MIRKSVILFSCVLASLAATTGHAAGQYAPPGYLAQTPDTGYSNYDQGTYAPPQTYGYNQGSYPQGQTYGYDQGGYAPAQNYAYPQSSYSQNFYPQPQANNYGGSFYPQPGYSPMPYAQPGYPPAMPYQYNQAQTQNQWRRPPPRRVDNEPFSLVPWDHLPGGEMPDFNPFSQGPFKRLPSKMFNTAAKDWAVQQFGDAWEDAINAPHNMGRMPGNVQAPSVSIPNPLDLGDQIGSSSATITEEAPEVIQGWFD